MGDKAARLAGLRVQHANDTSSHFQRYHQLGAGIGEQGVGQPILGLVHVVHQHRLALVNSFGDKRGLVQRNVVLSLQEPATGIAGGLAQHGGLFFLVHDIDLGVVEVELVADQVDHQVEERIGGGALAGGKGDALAGLDLAGADGQFVAALLQPGQQFAHSVRHSVKSGRQKANFVITRDGASASGQIAGRELCSHCGQVGQGIGNVASH